MAEVEDKIIEGHSYDGIKEYDNPLPPWWVYLFIGSIIWSVGYMYYYHVSDWGPSSHEEYVQEMTPTDEELVAQQSGIWNNFDFTVIKEESALESGKQIFEQNCASCHRNDGGGGIGPNLTDNYWIHGGAFEAITQVIIDGVPEKGMVSWKPLLTPDGILQVASYIEVKLQGTTPPNGKAPQGDLYEAEEEAPQAKENTDEQQADNTDEKTQG